MELVNVNDNCYLAAFFIFALVETLLCSGITYGWTSIVYVFKTENFYMDLCTEWYAAQNKSLETKVSPLPPNSPVVVGGAAAGYVDDGKLPGCPAQDSRLNLIFTVSLFCLCGIKFPAGVFIDRCGPRTARTVGGLMYIMACIGLGFVTRGYEDFLFPVFALICMGGSLLVISVYQVSNVIFRESRSRVMCMLHGAFDSSAVVLLVFKMIYDQGVDLKYIMFVYTSICTILILIGTFVLTPSLPTLFNWIKEESRLLGYAACVRRGSIAVSDIVVKSLDWSLGWNNFESVSHGSPYGSLNNYIYPNNRQLTIAGGDDEEEEEDYYSLASDSGEVPCSRNNQHEKKLGEYSTLLPAAADADAVENKHFAKGSVLNSIFSPLYLFELIYLVGFQLKLWYFVGTLADFLSRLTSNDKSAISNYVNIFGYVQFGGILVTPVIALVFGSKKGVTSSGATALPLTEAEEHIQRLSRCIAPFAITNLLCMVFCIVSAIENLYLQILSFILYTIVRGFLYSNHGAYMGAAFPASQFGTLYGLGIFIGGTFGVLQYGLFKITSGPLSGDPFWVNMFLLFLVTIGNIHPIYLWWYCRRERKTLHTVD